MNDLRRCAVCRAEKPLEEFEKHRQKPMGRGYRCRPCSAAKTRRDYDKHGPARRARVRKYLADNPKDRRRWRRASYRDRLRTEPEKERARIRLRNAIRAGTVVKPVACEECGRTGATLDGHHSDYTRPLDVVWLCRKCHGRRHRRDPEARVA